MNGAEKLRFECTGCGECCRRRGPFAYLYVNAEEIEALAGALSISPECFEERHTFIDDFGWTQVRFQNLNCPFLDAATLRCTVYEARPVQCRTFPFWRDFIDGGAWSKSVKKLCEGVAAGKPWEWHDVEAHFRDLESWADGACGPEVLYVVDPLDDDADSAAVDPKDSV